MTTAITDKTVVLTVYTAPRRLLPLDGSEITKVTSRVEAGIIAVLHEAANRQVVVRPDGRVRRRASLIGRVLLEAGVMAPRPTSASTQHRLRSHERKTKGVEVFHRNTVRICVLATA